MENFDFLLKTKIFFGKDKEKDVGRILKNYGATNVLLVYGSNSIKKSGLYNEITSSIEKENIKHCEISHIRANPTRSQVMCGLYIAKENNVNFILAIGGGSVMDAAKSIAVGYYYDGDAFDFNTYTVQPTKALPIGVILTISASGSECSTSCVISNDSNNIKQGFNSEIIRPVFAIENPELTYSVSKYQTACGIVDIISHSLERYMNKSEENLSDEFAIGLIRNVVINGRTAIENPNNYEARANLMIASSLSHCGLTSLGKTNYMAMHKMEHAISALHNNIAHGAGLAVVIPIWLSAAVDEEYVKIVRLINYVFNVNLEYTRENAIISIQMLKDYFKAIGMPVTLSELGITQDEVVDLVDNMTEKGTRVVGHTVKPLSKDEVMDAMLHYGY